jgi:hypothetical protein
MRINLTQTKLMKRHLVYTTDDSTTRSIDPTRFFAPATLENCRFGPPVEKDGLADKGFVRADLASRNIKAVIPGRSNRRVKIDHDRELYKQRNCIERMFGRLKINRSIATRYDQLANSFLGMVHIATARYWLKFVHAA